MNFPTVNSNKLQTVNHIIVFLFRLVFCIFETIISMFTALTREIFFPLEDKLH